MRSSVWPQSRRNETGSCLHLEPVEPHCCLLPSPRGRARTGKRPGAFGICPSGVPLEPEPLRMVWQSCQLIFFHTLLERRRKDECHQGGDPGGDSGQVTQADFSHPGCPLSSFPIPGDGFCHPPLVLLGGCALPGECVGIWGETVGSSRREMQDPRDGSGFGSGHIHLARNPTQMFLVPLCPCCLLGFTPSSGSVGAG